MGTYVPYTSKILVAKKGLDFFPEIARSGRHKLIQYNRGYGLYSLFVEIQTKAIFPINFKCEISEAWVRMYLTRVKFWSRKRSGFFSRNSKVGPPQTDTI